MSSAASLESVCGENEPRLKWHMAVNVFDHQAFFAAIDSRRRDQKLSWPALAVAVWDQSRVLNERHDDHPISAATIKKMADGTSCQHALFLLRWLGVPPEAFIAVPQPRTVGIPLPRADEAQRLRWHIRKLYGSLNASRTARGETWQQTAERLHCTPSQLTGLRTARFTTGMELAMRITQALCRPAADFIFAASRDPSRTVFMRPTERGEFPPKPQCWRPGA
jgi:hypothetical protein